MRNRDIIIAIMILLTAIYGGISYMLPVKYDIGDHPNDFKYYIAEKYISTLGNVITEKYGDAYVLLSDEEYISKLMSWNGRNIFTEAHVKINGKNMNGVVVVKFTGKRYWYNKYNWEVSDEI